MCLSQHSWLFTFGIFLLASLFESSWASRDSSCPRICPQTSASDPVCGSDGFIYPSLCEMRKKNCGKGAIYTVSGSNACYRSSGSLCDHKCTRERDPVCGTDGRTYLNKCLARVEVCRVGIEISHVGSCNNISAHRENCPVSCKYAPLDGPVCGSDGNVYNNTCLMKLLTCGQGVVKTSKKYCQTTRHCRESCWRVAKPTCGSDGKVYPNACRMKTKNCGKHVFEVPMAYCLGQERTAGGQPACPSTCVGEAEQPTCGSDGYVYTNECELKMLNCGPTKRQVTKQEFSKCRARYTKCLKVDCPAGEKQEPVCGTDGVTYPSNCRLQQSNCLKGIQLAHVGNCTLLSQREDPCPENCPVLNNDRPVCGSDGNAYRSDCEMRRLTCGQRVVAVATHHCPTTASCNQACPVDRNFVCGSDNHLYRNECEMKRQNCGKHVFVVPTKRCLQGFAFKGCQRICPPLYDPVCGTDAKTYSNSCFLELENCRSRSIVTKKHHGKCGYPIQEPKNYLY